MDSVGDLTKTKEQLLMAAAVHGLGPDDSRNTRVPRQVGLFVRPHTTVSRFPARCIAMRNTPAVSITIVLFLLGVRVAQADEKPTSKDLGKIPPPGGVPLRISERGKSEISTDYL